MLTKALLASKASTKQKTNPHRDFEDQNHIDSTGGGRFKKCFYQQIVSTQTTDCVPFLVQLRVSRGRVAEFILAIRREVQRSHIDVAHEQLL